MFAKKFLKIYKIVFGTEELLKLSHKPNFIKNKQ